MFTTVSCYSLFTRVLNNYAWFIPFFSALEIGRDSYEIGRTRPPPSVGRSRSLVGVLCCTCACGACHQLSRGGRFNPAFLGGTSCTARTQYVTSGGWELARRATSAPAFSSIERTEAEQRFFRRLRDSSQSANAGYVSTVSLNAMWLATAAFGASMETMTCTDRHNLQWPTLIVLETREKGRGNECAREVLVAAAAYCRKTHRRSG